MDEWWGSWREGGKEKRKAGSGKILRVLRVWREPLELLYPKVFLSTSTHSPIPNIRGQSLL